MMGSGERIQAAFMGEFADRRALVLNLSLYGARLTDCPLPRYYTDPEAYALGQREALALSHSDVIFSPFAICTEAESFGAEPTWFDRQPPQICTPLVDDIKGFSALVVPDVDTHPRLIYVREALARMRRYCPETPAGAIVVSPLGLPIMFFGFHRWFKMFLFDEQGRRQVVETVVEHTVRWANALLADGAACIVMPLGLELPHLLDGVLFDRLVAPVLTGLLPRINGPVLLHHTGAPLLPFVERLAALPNVAGLVVGGGDDLIEARRRMGPDLLLLGGIDGPTLKDRDAKSVELTCGSVLEAHRDDPKFIFTSTAGDIEYDTDPEMIGLFHKIFDRADFGVEQ